MTLEFEQAIQIAQSLPLSEQIELLTALSSIISAEILALTGT
jgi:hypothetical protein